MTHPIAAAVSGAAGFEVVDATEKADRLRLLGRAPDARRPDMIALINTLHDAMDGSWSVDISKLYFRPVGYRQCVWAWRFIFETKLPELPTQAILAAIQRVRPTPQAPVVSAQRTVPLPGATPDRNRYNARGKGAALYGQAIVGDRWQNHG